MAAGPVFRGVRNVKFDGTQISGVRAVSWSVEGEERAAGADDESWKSLAELVARSVRVEVATDFPEIALDEFDLGDGGTLEFTLEGVSSGAQPDLEVTVTGARLAALSGAPEQGETAARGKLVFFAVSADGATPPVSTAAVAAE